MAITPLNVCMGPANLYWGPYGSVEPTYANLTSTPSPAVWTDVGAIADGTAVLLEVDQTYTEIGAEQTIDAIGARLTKRTIQVTASLEETTLANMTLAMNQLASTSIQSGYSVLDPLTGSAQSQPVYTALIIDGWAPTAGTTETLCRRRIVIRKCLSNSKVDIEYEKSKPSLFATVWTAYYVSSSIAPFEVTDQTT